MSKSNEEKKGRLKIVTAQHELETILGGRIMQSLTGSHEVGRDVSSALQPEAMEEYREQMEKSEECMWAAFRLGLAHLENGEPGEALEAFDRSRRLASPGRSSLGPLWFFEGLAHKELGNLKEAARRFEKYVDVSESPAEGYLHLGDILCEMSSYKAAIEKYTVAIERDTEFVEALLGRGAAYVLDGQMDQALEDFRRVLHFHPENAEAHFYIGIIGVPPSACLQLLEVFGETVKRRLLEADG